MFKLESYITPIILSYVEKYVKNIRAEKSQLSLWGGDAVFRDLDLKLDVLEEELNLPFSFVSGHIHELLIKVPWTRLNAEPIVITINTIECVLTLHNDEKHETETTSSSGPPSSSRKRKIKRISSEEAPPGYIQSLINKIISNVSIVCNNLILKYVEEDIVLSLNVRSLKVTSANEMWTPAFTELSLPDLILRKLLKITDMTICLDRRDASGKIEIYQEPFLYRCSLIVHAAWCYDALHSKIPTVSRYDFHFDKLEFSLTDTQIPMFMRIADLILALYYGSLTDSAKTARHESGGADSNENDEHSGQHEHEIQSWTGWAWNVGTSVGTALLPVYWEEDDTFDVSKMDEKRDIVIHFGVFVDSARLVLKVTEQHSDKSLFGSVKLQFRPFAQIDCIGMFAEAVVRGVYAVNVFGGLTNLAITPLGTCLCGVPDETGNVIENSNQRMSYIQCGQALSVKSINERKYLEGSLFEKERGNEQGGPPMERRRSYNIDWDEHLEVRTEEKMLDKASGFAFDYLYFLDIPSDMSSDQISEVIEDLENCDLSERALCRLVLGPTTVNMCSGFLHRAQTVAYFCSAFDYDPYMSNNPKDTAHLSRRTSMTPEDSEATIQSSPFRVYQFTSLNPTLNLYCADHPIIIMEEIGYPRRKPLPNAGQISKLPGITLKLECLDGQMSRPMYPQKIVNAITKISPIKPQDLHSCSLQLNANIINWTLILFHDSRSTTIVTPNGMSFSLRSLMVSDQYQLKHDEISHKTFNFDMNSLKVRFTRPQTIVVERLLKSYFIDDPKPLKDLTSHLLDDALIKRMPIFALSCEGLHIQYDESKHLMTLQVSMEDFFANLNLMIRDSPEISQIPIIKRPQGESGFQAHTSLKNSPGRVLKGSATNFESKSSRPDQFVRVSLQLPIASEDQTRNYLLVANILRTEVNFDPKLHEWLMYTALSSTPSKTSSNHAPTKSHKRTGSNSGNAGIASIHYSRKVRSTSSEMIGRGLSSLSDSQRIPKDVRSLRSLRSSRIEESAKTLVDEHVNERDSSSSNYQRGTKFFKTWHKALSGFLVQVKVEEQHFYFPTSSVRLTAGKTIGEAMKMATSIQGGERPSIMKVVLPSMTLDNQAHKPQVQQFLHSVPFHLPESVWNTKRDNLPWSLVLQNFSVSVIVPDNNLKDDFSIVSPISTKCTLGMSMKAGQYEKKCLAFCVHADVSHVQVKLSESQLIVMATITEHLLELASTLIQTESLASSGESGISMKKSDPKGSSKSEDTEVFQSQDKLDFPDFADNQTSQMKQLSEVVEKVKTEENALSIWLQLTVPFVTMAAFSDHHKEQFYKYCQLRCEMEDYLVSFDWTPMFCKFKSRLQVIRLSTLKEDNNSGWTEETSTKGIVLSCGDDITRELHVLNPATKAVSLLPHADHFGTEKSVFSFIFTRAECQSVQQRWLASDNTFSRCTESPTRSMEKRNTQPRFVSEIDLKISPLDFVISPTELFPFFRMFCHLFSIKIPRNMMKSRGEVCKSDLLGMNINNNTLPLCYIKAKTIRVFVLSNHVEQTEGGDSCSALNPDLLLFQIHSLNLTPFAENPLSRIVVNPEMFSTPCSVFSVPGSPIEDRQYHVNVNEIGLFSGKWSDVVKKSEKPHRSALRTMGENPALEWNTQLGERKAFDCPLEVVLSPCISMFDVEMTLAPAIVLQRSENQDSGELIAGHSVEISATKPILVHLSTRQLHFISSLSHDLWHSASNVERSFLSPGKLASDSGVDCDTSLQSDIYANGGKHESRKFVPFEVLITGKSVSVSLFQLLKDEMPPTDQNVKMWRKQRHKQRKMHLNQEESLFFLKTDESEVDFKDEMRQNQRKEDIDETIEEEEVENENIEGKPEFYSHSDVGYEASEESLTTEEGPKSTIKIYPLLHMNFSQPHFFLRCTPEKQKLDIAVYDGGINLSPQDYFITEGGKQVPDLSDFPMYLMQTKQGSPNPKTGILPGLITCTFTDFLSWKAIGFKVSVDRPVKMDVSHETIILMDRIKATLQNSMPKVERSKEDSLEETGAVSELSSLMNKFSSISISSTQIVTSFSLDSTRIAHEFLAGFSELKLKARLDSAHKGFAHSVRKVHGDVSVSNFLCRFMDRGTSQNIVRPCSLNLNLGASWLPGSRIPVIAASFTCGKIHVCLSPHIVALINETCIRARDLPNDNEKKETSSCRLFTQSHDQVSEQTEPEAQQFIDDLRAGAFQFVTETSSSDPKPYQIVFSDNPLAMTWRYPQPRTLTQVTVFPMPYLSTSTQTLNEKQVLCSLQYWDECKASFFTYANFSLSEHEVTHLNLPTSSDFKRCAVSAVWRVFLQDNSENSTLYPKSLVSVMKVDSQFSPKIIPKLQISVEMPSVTVDLSHHLDLNECCLLPPLDNFFITFDFPVDQTFASVHMDSINMRMDSWIQANDDIKTLVRMSLQPRIDLLDYQFLAMHNVLYLNKLQGQFFVSNKTLNCDSFIHSSPVNVQLGQFAQHTLMASWDIWARIINPKPSFELSPILSETIECVSLPTKFVFCNDTLTYIRIGQADTEENILLAPGGCSMYTWRSQKARTLLRACIEEGFWKWCEPFEVNLKDGNEVRLIREIDHGTSRTILVVVCTQTEIPNQIQVKISGLLSTASLLDHDLEMRVIIGSKDPAHKEALSEQATILKNFSSSSSFLVDTSVVRGVKVRLSGIGTPWSGLIPLKIDLGRKTSVLVRIPSKDKANCLTVWCRIFEEDINEQQRTLMIFSPMYMARSLLPNSMKILLNAPNCPSISKRSVQLPGRDKPIQLPTTGASDTKYEVAFQMTKDLAPSDPISVSWGIIEQVKKSSESETKSKLSIEDVINAIPFYGSHGLKTSWPFLEDMIEGVEADIDVWEDSFQPNTDVQVNFVQFHPLCNTLCIDINPWCMIVNTLGMNLLFRPTNSSSPENVIIVKNNSILVPPKLSDNSFFLGVEDGDQQYFSQSLHLTDQEWHLGRRLMPIFDGKVPAEGTLETKIVIGNHVCFITLKSRLERGIRIIRLMPRFFISNLSPEPILCAPLSMNSTKKISTKCSNLDLIGQEAPPSTEKSSASGAPVCIPLLWWQVVGESPRDRAFDGFHGVSFAQNNTDWSVPLILDEDGKLIGDKVRKVLLPLRDGEEENNFVNRQLIVTFHSTLSEQTFILVNNDKTFTVIVNNNLTSQILIRQCSKDKGPVNNGYSEQEEQYQSLAPERQCYFAPSSVLYNYPQSSDPVGDIFLTFTLNLSTKKHDNETGWELVDSKNAHWCSPINISTPHEGFVSLPDFGDCKVTVERVANCSYVFVDALSKSEISAKDIRSRISSSSPLESQRAKSPQTSPESFHLVESSFVSSEDEDNFDQSFLTSKSPETRVQSRATEYHSFTQDNQDQHISPKRWEVFANVFLENFRLILTDDCVEKRNERTELISFDFRAISATLRPHKRFTSPLRSYYNLLPLITDLQVCIGDIQVDNQMYHHLPHEFAVVLASQQKALGEENEPWSRTFGPSACQTEEALGVLRNRSVANFTFHFDSTQGGVGTLKTIRVKIKPLIVNLEDQFLFKLSEIMAKSIVKKTYKRIKWNATTFELPSTVASLSRDLSRQLNLDEILIEPCEMSLSVHASIKMYIGLEQSPLTFSSFHRKNIVTTNFCLGQILARHYISGALFRAGWVVGSLDLIGSPTGLTRTVGDGLRDFVALPYQGFFQGPWAFLGGLTTGSTSLVKHVTAGTLTSMTYFASSVSRNMDRLSLDREHCQRNELFRREKPQGFGQGFVNGLSGVGVSLLGAIGGLAHHPINSLMEEGLSPTGLVKGITRGLVGVFTKPLGGAAEFFAQTGHGLLYGTGWSKCLKPVKIPMPEHVVSFANSDAKNSWKFLPLSLQQQQMSVYRPRKLLCSIEATSSNYSPCTLLLTVDALIVVNVEEDALESVYSVFELEVVESDDDPTKLRFSILQSPTSSSAQVTMNDTIQRVEQFVMESGVHFVVSDLEDEDESEDENQRGNSEDIPELKENTCINPPTIVADDCSKRLKEIVFYASPLQAEGFKAFFNVARAQARFTGFDMI